MTAHTAGSVRALVFEGTLPASNVELLHYPETTLWKVAEVRSGYFATDGQSARQIFITVWHLPTSCCGRPPWREDGSVIYSYNLLSLSCPSPAELVATSYCLIWDSSNLESQVLVFISPRNRVPQLYLRALSFLFVASYDSQGYDGGILTSPHMGLTEVEMAHWLVVGIRTRCWSTASQSLLRRFIMSCRLLCVCRTDNYVIGRHVFTPTMTSFLLNGAFL
jgi:hypothetical protein